MRISASVALLAACTALAAAGSAALGAGQHEDAAQHAQIERGKQLYADHCSHCHGFNMVTAGDVTYDLRQFPHDQPQRFLYSVVNGKNDRMPPWGDVLTLEQIGDIWAYVRTGGKAK